MTRLVAAVLALLLAGCVSVPAEGPVVQGRPAGDPLPPPNVAVLAAGPRPGDDPAAIVEGFLSAMASYEPGYPTAREFLTSAAAGTWDPRSGIAIYEAGEGSRRVTTSEDAVRTALPLVARVGEDGGYRAASEGASLELDLQMARVDGEWRIVNPPDGLVMSTFDFGREFAAYATYFFDPGFQVLVPDQTYLPVRGNLPTLLAEELLDGPSAWLDPAVQSALGPGVALATGAVPVAGTTARVDLTDQVLQASAQQRDRLAAQLAWTLQQAPGITEISLVVGGQPLPLPSSDTGVVAAESFAYLDPAAVPAASSLFAVSEGAVISVGEDRAQRVRGPLGQPGLFRSVGVTLTGTRAAAVSADGASLTWAGLADDAVASTPVLGTDLSTPSLDRQERVWVVDRAGDSSQVLLVAEDDGQVEAGVVPAAELEAVRVQRLVLAPDGVRLAAVYERGGVGRLAVGLVLPEPDGTVAVGQLREIPLDGVGALDVAWASATALALLADADGQAQPYLVELANGALSSRGQVLGAASLAASPGQALVIGTREGQLLQQDALQEWLPIIEGTAPTYPG